jgi:hypothetical protein
MHLQASFLEAVDDILKNPWGDSESKVRDRAEKWTEEEEG